MLCKIQPINQNKQVNPTANITNDPTPESSDQEACENGNEEVLSPPQLPLVSVPAVASTDNDNEKFTSNNVDALPADITTFLADVAAAAAHAATDSRDMLYYTGNEDEHMEEEENIQDDNDDDEEHEEQDAVQQLAAAAANNNTIAAAALNGAVRRPPSNSRHDRQQHAHNNNNNNNDPHDNNDGGENEADDQNNNNNKNRNERNQLNEIHPNWPSHIVSLSFFGPCPTHPYGRKNTCNYYCICCGPATNTAMCEHCLPHHAATCTGKAHQIYRYMHHDIIRTAAFGSLFPLHDIQYYKANNNHAVHLRKKAKPSTKSPAAFTVACGGCKRHMDPRNGWRFCSLACKLGLDPFGDGSDDEEEQGGVDDVVNLHGLMMDNNNNGINGHNRRNYYSRATTPSVPKEPLVGAKRRKCASPQRSAVM